MSPSAARASVAPAKRSLTRDVRVPRIAEPAIEARPVHVVEQVVVEEPEHAVRHDVVVQPVFTGIEVEQFEVDAEARGRSGRGRIGVVFVHRRRDPRRVGLARAAVEEQRAERADDAPRPAVRGERPVVVALEPVRPAMRDDDHCVELRSRNKRSQSSSSRVEQKLARTCSRPAAPIASAFSGSRINSSVRLAASSTLSTR